MPPPVVVNVRGPVVTMDTGRGLEALRSMSGAGSGPLWDPLADEGAAYPMLIKGAASDWPAVRTWSLRKLGG